MPPIVGIVFVVGLVAAAYSAAGSAITSLTTSVTLDILDGYRRTGGDEQALGRLRRRVHALMATLMAIVIMAFYYLNSDDTISAVYTLASYTYGPILGLFAFGMFTRRQVADRLVPAICIASPVLAGLTQWAVATYTGYHIGFELLLLNALYALIFLTISSATSSKKAYVEEPA